MNKKNYKVCVSRSGFSLWWGVLLISMTAGMAHAQIAADYSVNPPFHNASQNMPSGSGSTVAVLDKYGSGALYQTFYYPLYADAESGKTISWGGVVQAVFVDESGRYREDNGVKGKLEDTSIDYVIDIFRDQNVAPARTRFQRFQQVGGVLKPVGTVAELDTLNTVWNARDILSDISQDNLLIQRQLDLPAGFYAEAADTKRFVFTLLDKPDMASTDEVDAGEIVDFISSAFDPDVNDNWRYLGLAEKNVAMNLVDYVRGRDMAGWRPRLINLPGDSSAAEKYWILGDIVHSTPLVVGPPAERYDRMYGDASYQQFKAQYAHRRQMIYVGANDGMLHAFNGGVWNAEDGSLQTQGYIDAENSTLGQAHTLGAEMWAYVPMNLLPHLQWLTAVDYPHVYYVDAPAQAFDVNIFAHDLTHPAGWGTILVVGMRLGGGDFELDLDGNGVPETMRRSAVIVLDITDPEKPPVLLAELTSPALNFTTSMPAVIKARKPDVSGGFSHPTLNSWLLILGSGPEDLVTATSPVSQPTLLAWDLQTRKHITLAANLQTPVTEPAGFWGSFTVVDRDDDYIDDVLYVGTVEGTEQVPAGRLKRILLNPAAPGFGLADGTAKLSTFFDVGRPIVAKPLFIHSFGEKENLLLFGTGRSFTYNDYYSAAGQQLLGLKETADFDTSTLELADLFDSTKVIVQTDALSSSPLVWDGEVNNALLVDDVKLGSFDELLGFMDSKQGWYKSLQTHLQAPAERVVNEALMLRSSAIFTSFLPDLDSSENNSESFIHALHYRTGTADETGFLGGSPEGIVVNKLATGSAELVQPVLKISSGSEPKPHAETTTPTTDASDSRISLMTGASDGSAENFDVYLPPSIMKKLSWELLDVSF